MWSFVIAASFSVVLSLDCHHGEFQMKLIYSDAAAATETTPQINIEKCTQLQIELLGDETTVSAPPPSTAVQ